MNLYSPTHDFIGITSQIMEKGSSTDLGLFFMAAWSIWGNRNNAIHNDASCPPSQVWEIVKRSLFDFTTSNLSHLPPHPSASVHWSPPPPGFHKFNVDGATNNIGNHSNIRVIIRDHTRAIIGAFNKLLPSGFPDPTTEAFALLQGVLFAVEMGLTKVIFESDDLALIQVVNSNENGGDLGHILQDIRSQALVFNWSTFQHLKRDDNMAVHELARDARLMSHSHTWKGVSPPFIQQILIEDML